MNQPGFICPLCTSPLNAQSNSLKCDYGHQFDYAKEGYVHLLPVQFKKSLNPGDDKNMVLARRAFLSAGYYEFLQQAVVERVSELRPNITLDLGCGEGYYTNAIEQSQSNIKMYGVDISKDAIKYASKRNKNIHYCVASNANVPLAEASVDVILNIFAPVSVKECQRLLKKDGYLLTVNPGANHLFELKQKIYDKPERHSDQAVPEGFNKVKHISLEKTLEIKSEQQLSELLTMTPFGWKMTPDKKQTAIASLPFSVSLHFVVDEYTLAEIQSPESA